MRTDCSDYISPEEIKRLEDRARRERRTRRDLLIVYALAVLVIVVLL